MKNITTIILFTLLAFASLNSNAQRTASLIIDSTSINTASSYKTINVTGVANPKSCIASFTVIKDSTKSNNLIIINLTHKPL